MAMHEFPDGLPVLSRGKHRSPRKGACFMEMASVLANEPWSDHPSCTHPLVAHLARLVNDYTSDQSRSELAILIPSVVGLRGGGLRGGGLTWTVNLTTVIALDAITDVPERSQRALAAGLIRCEELAADLGPGTIEASDAVRRALEQVPLAVAWARQFVGGTTISPKQFEKRSAPSVIQCAVRGLATSAVTDPDARLRSLLSLGIATARRLEPQPDPAREDAVPQRPTTGSLSVTP